MHDADNFLWSPFNDFENMFRVRPKTEEFLYHLLWSCDQLMRPTFRNITDSFEAWAYRNGFSRQLAELERQRLLETNPRAEDSQDAANRAVRLTMAGRLHALGGCDPEALWKRPWDGRWRMVLFDLPVKQNAARDRLRLHLRKRKFGRLQNSVWICPDPLPEEKELLSGIRVNAGSLLILEARPCAGERDDEIVAAAWDFNEINSAYAEHAEVLAARPTKPTTDEPSAQALRNWAQRERLSWLTAMERDPFLPERLLPEDYPGRKSWQERVKSFGKAASQLKRIRENEPLTRQR